MPATVRPYRPDRSDDLAALRTVLRDPAIVAQYDMYEGEDGAERLLGDPYTPAAGVHLAFVDRAPAGFACVIVLPAQRPWAMLRGGVLLDFQRRGIGRALHDRVSAYVRTQTTVPHVQDLVIAAWQPLERATAMVERLGYAHDRWFWLMQRPRSTPLASPGWPEGVETRVFDGSDAMIADWNVAYNESFAANYRFVPSPLSHVHKLVKKPGFRADGLLLAYRDGKVAGFCRNELFAARGEIGTLGTLPAARGIGLGRALLRWGVGWLERESPLPVTLLVDGENDSALALYRSEGFEVVRTRHLWAQSATPA